MNDPAAKKRLQRFRARIESILEMAGYDIIIVRGKPWDFEARRPAETRLIKVLMSDRNTATWGINYEVAFKNKAGKIKYLPADDK